MNEKLKELLDGKIETALNALDKFEAGTNEYGAAVEDLRKLYQLKTDEEKAVMEDAEKRSRREMEAEQFKRDADIREREAQFKADQTERQRLVDYVKLGAEIAGIVLPLMFYAGWLRKGFKFEESGKFTSDTFRGFIMKLKPTKL